MNILIIGANGFTGRRMLDDLVSCGKYNMTASSLRDDIAPGDGYRFIRADIRRAAKCRLFLRKFARMWLSIPPPCLCPIFVKRITVRPVQPMS